MNRPNDDIKVVQALRPKFLTAQIQIILGVPVSPVLLTCVNMRTKKVFQQMVRPA